MPPAGGAWALPTAWPSGLRLVDLKPCWQKVSRLSGSIASSAALPAEALVPGDRGVSCNPIGQALALQAAGTDLNIAMGLCLGHDLLFARHSHAPVTTLAVKDRLL
jgi:Uncharacterized metal-binding protein conserved in archaea